VQFTGSAIDDGIDAWKRQLYDANMAYLSDPIVAMVPSDIPDIDEHLKQLGFDVTGEIKGEGRLRVKGPKKVMKLDGFAGSTKGPDKKSDPQVAQVMMQAVMSIAKNADLFKAIGPKSMLKMIENAAKLAGADKDFKLRPDQRAEMDALNKKAQSIQIACANHANDTIAKPVAEQMAKQQAEIQTLNKAMENLLVKLGLAKPAPPAPAPANQPPPQNAPAPGNTPAVASGTGEPEQPAAV
jgi:hypothetical protein